MCKDIPAENIYSACIRQNHVSYAFAMKMSLIGMLQLPIFYPLKRWACQFFLQITSSILQLFVRASSKSWTTKPSHTRVDWVRRCYICHLEADQQPPSSWQSQALLFNSSWHCVLVLACRPQFIFVGTQPIDV